LTLKTYLKEPKRGTSKVIYCMDMNIIRLFLQETRHCESNLLLFTISRRSNISVSNPKRREYIFGSPTIPSQLPLNLGISVLISAMRHFQEIYSSEKMVYFPVLFLVVKRVSQAIASCTSHLICNESSWDTFSLRSFIEVICVKKNSP